MLLGGVVLSAARATAYPDVAPRHWAYRVISAMTERGLVRGYPDGFFYPDRPVSRAEVAVMLVNVLGLKVQPVVGSTFADLSGHWAEAF
ncbi:MAG: S-layer homology domain-containing protein, partial [Firmicutes bacterium]|nr:S-layer homology domain-containing protein [Bacillota bacterium]